MGRRLTTGLAKAIWAENEKDASISFSPQRTALLYSHWSGLCMLDPKTGDISFKPQNISRPSWAAISTDGKRIALITADKFALQVLSTSTQKLESAIPFQAFGFKEGTPAPTVQWVDPGTLLLDNKYLLALKPNAVVWEFTNSIPVTVIGPDGVIPTKTQSAVYILIAHRAELTIAGKTVWSVNHDYTGPDPNTIYMGANPQSSFLEDSKRSYLWLQEFKVPVPLYKSQKDMEPLLKSPFSLNYARYHLRNSSQGTSQ
jgi:hypothetical protein